MSGIFECFYQFGNVVGKIGHRWEYYVGAGIEKGLCGDRPGVDRDGENLCGSPGFDTQRGVFDDDGFVGSDTGFG